MRLLIFWVLVLELFFGRLCSAWKSQSYICTCPPTNGTTPTILLVDETTAMSLMSSMTTDFPKTTLPPPVCTAPARSVPINAYLPQDSYNTSNTICPIGSCVCPSQPSGWQNTLFSVLNSLATSAKTQGLHCESNVPTNPTFATSISQSVVPSQTSSQTQQVIPDTYMVSSPQSPTQTTTYTYTPVETCAMYAVLQCADPLDQDGLTYNGGQINVTCASQLNANNVSQLLGPTSGYLQVASVGCGACPNPVSACGPYVAPFSDPSFLFE
uniref:Uncharacterized protein n=1 Tax=Ditylenchus dipsaci TaxID=166011 RepID=A0A915DNS9_9BILA